GLDTGEHATVRDGQAGDLGQLHAAVLGVREPFARELPALAEVAAAPDAGTVPFAGGGRVDRARSLVVHRVVDRPALTERAAQLPAAATGPAREREQALARTDQHEGLRHSAS